MNIAIVYYSMYGHVLTMARAAAEAAAQVPGVTASLLRVPETLPEEVLAKMGALDAAKAQSDIPLATPEALAAADALLFGTPTRFGNMTGQMRQFLDSTGGLWAKGALIGKAAGVFTSSATQHGGQESTILTFIPTLMHHGMVVVGLPYSFAGQTGVDEVVGGSPYGASTIAGSDGSRTPSARELDGVRFQARHLAEIAKKLAA
ncbi:NAD(P)H dehydrogenase (quinone) [Humidesulfovibrio mexicanus]|uniref:NAD(P)H dehydrogenase (quinone) n=1 Tax=Humidesulfovibrio mexicanus TaxID=147047 RepID=A0A239ASK8_9BACT|nr:NAD(P)H:quinone oxidoreductase [Humidesulfovibrio mexicanus]SNR98509.1 NAD(P)H dehydrogenase (quinone) [Humidesulfovibrio mexicanus]